MIGLVPRDASLCGNVVNPQGSLEALPFPRSREERMPYHSANPVFSQLLESSRKGTAKSQSPKATGAPFLGKTQILKPIFDWAPVQLKCLLLIKQPTQGGTESTAQMGLHPAGQVLQFLVRHFQKEETSSLKGRSGTGTGCPGQWSVTITGSV